MNRPRRNRSFPSLRARARASLRDRFCASLRARFRAAVFVLPAAAAVAAAADAADAGGGGGDFFRTAPGQPALSVRENVERVGEAVVQIRTPTGLGSGFIIHPAGHVITNAHVIADEYAIPVTLFRRSIAGLQKIAYNKVRIVALDPRLDLALLKIEEPASAAEPAFSTVPLGDSNALTEGQTVFAIGSPLGLDRTVSQGIISSRNRPLDSQLYIQTTTQLNPGNAGAHSLNP